jgi:hypothetical protein
MFHGLSVAESQAQIERVKAEISQEKLKQAERELSRERKRIQLQDREDRLLDLQIATKDKKIGQSEAGLQAENILLEQSRDRVKYLSGKRALQQNHWTIELQIDELELAGSQERLRQLKNASETLGHRLDNRISQRVLGGLSNAVSDNY